MTTSSSLPFDHQQTATQAFSRVTELVIKEPEGKPDMPPYFSWPRRWPVSAAGLWGSFFKSLLRF